VSWETDWFDTVYVCTLTSFFLSNPTILATLVCFSHIGLLSDQSPFHSNPPHGLRSWIMRNLPTFPMVKQRVCKIMKTDINSGSLNLSGVKKRVRVAFYEPVGLFRFALIGAYVTARKCHQTIIDRHQLWKQCCVQWELVYRRRIRELCACSKT
jgi:hypothetical protein